MSSLDPTATRWRKSSHSAGSGGDCVEIADITQGIAIRDSKDPQGPHLIIHTTAWHSLAREIKTGIHDQT
ncbi:DUF397 domain-containing protein [Actinomadura adrarensis]|uniref:DUF397 domain-containing protein n=1 Tax=Actinomadura adrarensis TaxID=1819600 RepID=A0ABW3CSN7_9ACTN